MSHDSITCTGGLVVKYTAVLDNNISVPKGNNLFVMLLDIIALESLGYSSHLDTLNSQYIC